MSVTDALKELSELLNDSQCGYADAAERLDDKGLEKLMMKFGNGRAPMIEDLANELARMGEEVPLEGTTKGSLHRTWLGMRDTLTGSSKESILAECERGDENLLEKYRSVIGNAEVPHPLKAMLQEHAVMVEANLDELRSQEQTLKHK